MYSINVTPSAMSDLQNMPQIVNKEAGKGIQRIMRLEDPAMADEVVPLRNHAGYFRWKMRDNVRFVTDNATFRIIFSINYRTRTINVVGVVVKSSQFDSFARSRCNRNLATVS